MAEDFLPPVVAILAADISAYVAGLTEAQARMAAFATTQTAEMARMGTAMQAEASKAGRSFNEVGLSAERMAEETKVASTGIVSAGDRLIAEAKAIEASSGKMAAAWQRDFAAMKRQTEELAVGMQAAETKVAASWADLEKAEANHSKATAGHLAMAGAAAAAIGAIAVKMAGDFQQSTNKLVTSAGETEEGLAVVRRGMLTLAGEVGVSAVHLSDAIYKIESAGYHAEAGLGVLKAAMQGAKAEGADGIKVADALSSALRDYYPHAVSAAEVTKASADVMSKLIGATSAGKMTFDDLAGALNSILPVSSAANITLSDTLGVLASMTVHGISAEQATQNMADAIRHLQAPTQVMSKAMATLGIDSVDVAAKLGERGLSGTMQMLAERIKAAMPPGSDKVILELGDALSKSTPKVQELGQRLLEGSITMAGYAKEAKALDPLSAKQAASFATLAGSYHQLGTQQISGAEVMKTYGGMLQQVMGDATGLKVALMTTNENAGYTNEAIKTISGSTADAAGNVKGWSEVQNSFNQKMAEAKAGLGAFAIAVGTALLPVLMPMVKALGEATRWMTEHPTLAKIMAAAIVTLTVALSAAAVAIWAVNIAMYANPVGLIIAGIIWAIAVIVAWGYAFYQLYNHWSTVEKYLSGAWNAFINWTKGVWRAVAKWFEDLWHDIAGFFTGTWDDIAKGVSDAWDGIIAFFKGLPKKIGDALGALGDILGDLAKKGWHGFTHGLEVASEETLHFLDRLPYLIGEGLGFLAGLLARLAIDGWGGFTHGLYVAYEATTKFLWDLPGNIQRFLTGAGKWLEARGREVVDGFTYGIHVAYEATAKFFWELPGNIGRFLTDAYNWIKRNGHDLLVGFWHGILDAWHATEQFLWDLPGNIWGFVKDAYHWIKGNGHDLLVGFGHGVSDAWGGVAQWFWDLPGNLYRFFDHAIDWLVYAGKNIVYGIWNGVTEAAGWLWQKMKDFGSGIVDGFNKGMKSQSPSLLAAESGKFFVLGVGMGIDNNAHIALTAAKNLASGVVGAMSGMSATPAFGVAGGGSLGYSGGGGPTVVHVHVNVEGSVHSVASLRAAVQDAVLQHKYRNSSNGLG